MKTILTFLYSGIILCMFSNKVLAQQVQLDFVKDELLNSNWKLEAGLGMDAHITPSRLNTIEVSGLTRSKEEFKSSSGYTPGIIAGISIEPISNRFLSYRFDMNYSETWMFAQSGSYKWKSHHIALGYDQLFFVMQFEEVRKRYTLYDRSGRDNQHFTEEIAYSLYESKRKGYGIQWRIKGDANKYLEAKLVTEQYTNFIADNAKGYSFTYFTNDNHFLLELYPGHLIKGNTFVSPGIPKPTELEKTGWYAHFAYRKTFNLSASYRNTKKKLLY